MSNAEEKEAREYILQLVADYCDKFHKREPYVEGQRIPYASRIYDHNEMVNLVNASLDFWLTSGKYTDEFENKLSNFLKVPFCSFVNSGSSANLLAFMTLTSPLLGEKRICPGDEVITIACGFPTTISPIIQYGTTPVFVDIDIPQYNIDVTQLEKALSPKTKAVIIAHTLGNPFDIQTVKDFCKKNNLWLIEDNCDSLGSTYTYNGNICYTGTVGDIGTSSFYPPHHMTTGEGGAVYTKNPLLHKIIRSLRDWGRDCSCPSGKDNTCNHRFTMKFGDLPLGYDHKYVYSHFGYNLKASDLQAAIGCAQIDKLPSFIEKRKTNHQLLLEKLEDLSDIIILPKPLPNSSPSWFGFAITCRSNTDRDKIVNYLETNNVQTRMLFASNITLHPCFIDYKANGGKYRIIGDLHNTNIVLNNTFWIGVYPGMTIEMIDKMSELIHQAFNE